MSVKILLIRVSWCHQPSFEGLTLMLKMDDPIFHNVKNLAVVPIDVNVLNQLQFTSDGANSIQVEK